ncbi:MAG: energy transducer TonB [Paludibacteraceae bacterium]
MVIVGEPNIRPHYNPTANKKFVSPDKPARFVSGNKELMQYFVRGVNYPASDRGSTQKKEIKVRFLVDRFGKISAGEVAGEVSSDTQKEALDVINQLPQFIPAEQNGEKIDATIEIPITFRMLKL